MPKIMAVIAIMCVCGGSAWAEVNVETLTDAIKKAENSKSKPYGIMKAYCTEGTEARCRKGCIQTIEHALRDYKGPEEGFIAFLGSRYAPIGANNDKSNLNSNWVKNVKYFYSRGLTS